VKPVKIFRFRLKKILDVRRIEEDQAALRLKQSSSRLREIDNRIETARRDHAEVYRELSQALAGGALGPEAPVQAATHASRIERAIREAERERLEAMQNLRSAEQDLRRRRTARRALEELESRALTGWKDEARRAENAFLDEVASIRHAREA
jgi:flagellar export protein FliJ